MEDPGYDYVAVDRFIERVRDYDRFLAMEIENIKQIFLEQDGLVEVEARETVGGY